MFTQEIISFLQELSENNHRDWFQANKPRYNELREKFLHFTDMVINEVTQFDPSIKGITAKDAVFRINRDIRFSNDKSPYKTNMGAFIVPGGKKSGKAGYYIHLEPNQSFLAGGIYMPPSPILKSIRKEIFEHTDEFKFIIENSQFKFTFGEIWGEKLKQGPKDFPKDFQDIELLKFKSYTVARNLSKNELISDNFFDHVVEVFECLYPFNRFLNQSFEDK